jgi:hypothetical protein
MTESVPTPPPAPDLRALAAVVAKDRAVRWGYTETLGPVELASYVHRQAHDDNLLADLAAALPAVAEAIETLKDRYHQDLVLDTPADTAAYHAGRQAIEDAATFVRGLAGTAPADSPSATLPAQDGPAVPGAAEADPRPASMLRRVDDLLCECRPDGRCEHNGEDAVVAFATEDGGGTEDHVYLSTACLHGRHDYCRAKTGHRGAKWPAQCKFCPARCVCDCHAPAVPGTGDDPQPERPNDERLRIDLATAIVRAAQERSIDGLADTANRLAADRDRLAAAIRQIGEIHVPRGPYCHVCDRDYDTDQMNNPLCAHKPRYCRTCWRNEDTREPWPCPTVAALSDAGRAQDEEPAVPVAEQPEVQQ